MRIEKYTISNNQGDSIDTSNYGARLLRWSTLAGGLPRNIILGYENLEDYLNDRFFIGAIVGPYANRIAYSTCTVEKKRLQLDANESEHHLHGGKNSLADIYWECAQLDKNSITLSCVLADGFNGYPGDMSFEVTYCLSEKSELTVSINVASNSTTIAGPTAHPYFNLGPDDSVGPHTLQILSKHYTPVDHAGLPKGDISPVASTQFDYLTPRVVSEQTVLDDNFLLSFEDTTTSSCNLEHARLQSPDKKLKLHVSSNYPAMQVYTGQYLQAPFSPFQGICLEPQFCPDSPNQAAYPFHITTKQQPLNTHIVYRLEKVIV